MVLTPAPPAWCIRRLACSAYEWTAGDSPAYSGFAPWPCQDYPEEFHGAGYRSARGGTSARGAVAYRRTLRKRDHPVRRQIIAGWRTARDAEPYGAARCAATCVI